MVLEGRWLISTVFLVLYDLTQNRRICPPYRPPRLLQNLIRRQSLAFPRSARKALMNLVENQRRKPRQPSLNRQLLLRIVQGVGSNLRQILLENGHEICPMNIFFPPSEKTRRRTRCPKFPPVGAFRRLVRLLRGVQIAH